MADESPDVAGGAAAVVQAGSAARGVRSPEAAAEALVALPADQAAAFDNFLRELGLLGQHRLARAAVMKNLDNGQSITAVWLPELWEKRGAPALRSLADDGLWRCR